jgi:hypothetical protein
MPVAQIYELIVDDFQSAVDNLDNSYKGRASKAAAQGLLAKVYLTLGTNYGEARTLCEQVIGSGFTLQDDFYDVFYNEMNSEIIFAIRYESANPNESQSFSSEFTSAIRAGREDGQNIVNANLRELFINRGGNRTAVSITDLEGSLDDDENEVAKFFPDGNDFNSNYGANARDAGNDYIALRYADVLLMHAEAILAGGTQTSSGPAIDSYMEVRVRAGFDPITDRPTVLTKDELLVERRVELAFENQRYHDLVRFGVLDAVLSDHSDEMGYVYDPRKALLLPIPARERNLSGGLLSQNPGY